ncbi:MAG: hypothetical protein ACOX81_10180 [Candidatus Heteroscillospira sp.]|jgi:hypothetical protein
MAKGAYIGVGGVARKVKKGYIGAPNTTVVASGSQNVKVFVGDEICWKFSDYTASGGLIIPTNPTQVVTSDAVAGDYITLANPSAGVTSIYKVISMTNQMDDGWDMKVQTYVARLASNGTAHKIKKAYIGIGGVARPCWSGGELAYYGTITGLSVARKSLAATTVGNYALFGGGNSGSSAVKTVDAYNASLTRTIPEALYSEKCSLSATTVGNYALFGSGSYVYSYGSAVDAYDTSLTRTSPISMSKGGYNYAATTVGNYALFGGGYSSSESSKVDAYDTSLTRTLPTTLSSPAEELAATTVGNYALFGGGHDGNSVIGIVNAYDTSLTRTSATSMSISRAALAATTVGEYALFGGGRAFNVTTVVDAYNSALTRSTATELSVARQELTATSVEGFALFGGGYPQYATIDAYDLSLTRSIPTSLSQGRAGLAATSISNYALFGGGYANGLGSFANVDAYVVA